MTLAARLRRLERGHGNAPAGCVVYGDGAPLVHLTGGGAMALGAYEARWPQHPTLKAYTDGRMVDPLVADWGDAPPPRSSADA